MLGKRMAFFVPASGHHFFADAISHAHPLCAVGWKGTFVGPPEAPIQSNPVHDPLVGDRLPTPEVVALIVGNSLHASVTVPREIVNGFVL